MCIRDRNISLLRSRLKLKHIQSESVLKAHHPLAIAQFDSVKVKPGSLRKHASKLISAGAVASRLVLTMPNLLPIQAALPSAALDVAFTPPSQSSQPSEDFLTAIKTLLPRQYGHLNSESETQMEKIIKDKFGITAVNELDGNKLNHSYGLIGAEQHLPRFPGDQVTFHNSFLGSGITPGRGAWGYFANSREDLTPDLIEKEKYYFAVQTLYLSDWSTRLSYLRDWYKFRKMIAINPANGKTIVGVVGDSGPAMWTGKHFGGSPEIMSYLELNVGKQKGAVLLYFVDDPGDKVPLGPVEYNLQSPPKQIPG